MPSSVDPGDLPAGSDSEVSAERHRTAFDSVYREYAPFVWRSACRLGVPRSAAEDVMQEAFLIVHRRLADFEAGTSMRAWLSAIVVRLARAHSRHSQRGANSANRGEPIEPDDLADPRSPNPEERAERDETVRELYAILGAMAEDRREIFVLADLEQLSAPEIAHALDMNLNTVYWKLRMARQDFERHLFRRRAMVKRNER